MNALIMLAYKWVTNGWWVMIQTPEKDKDRNNLLVFEFFPEIQTEKEVLDRWSGKRFMTPINAGSFTGESRNFGDFTIKGFVRFLPTFEPIMARNSLNWARLKDEKFTRIGQTKVDTRAFGQKTVLERTYRKTYIFSNGQWIPELVYQDQQQIMKEGKVLAYKAMFMEAIKNAGSKAEMSRVVEKFSVPFEAPAKEEKKYTVVEIPANGEVGPYARVEKAKYVPVSLNQQETKAEMETPKATYSLILDKAIQSAGIAQEHQKNLMQAMLQVIHS